MFDFKHYVPILKWKPAEQQALEKLDDKQKKLISPLFQILLPDPSQPKRGAREKTPEEQYAESVAKFKEKIPLISSEILKHWGRNPAFIDLNLLIDKPLQEQGFIGILNDATALGIFLIPVTSLNSEESVQKTVTTLAKKKSVGVCLRLFRSDFSTPGLLDKNIKKFLKEYSLSEGEVDILIDFQITDEQCLNLPKLTQEIPNLLKWRTFTFASGAFPVDLTACQLGINYLPRSDWRSWFSEVNSLKLERNPAFGDYTIQHPFYKKQARFFSPSASIRYTREDSWLIMRGQKGRTEQYLANAQLLSGLPEFYGEKFSEGDAFIMEKGKDLKSKKTGNATGWLRAGINHHLACTVNQIANLP